jgi:hypothetical protein
VLVPSQLCGDEGPPDASLLVLLLAVLGAIGVHRDAVEHTAAAERERTQVDAVLVAEATSKYQKPGAAAASTSV